MEQYAAIRTKGVRRANKKRHERQTHKHIGGFRVFRGGPPASPGQGYTRPSRFQRRHYARRGRQGRQKIGSGFLKGKERAKAHLLGKDAGSVPVAELRGQGGEQFVRLQERIPDAPHLLRHGRRPRRGLVGLGCARHRQDRHPGRRLRRRGLHLQEGGRRLPQRQARPRVQEGQLRV